MERVCKGQGIAPPPVKTRNGPAIARMCCPLWWRRKLRKHHGQTVESAAILLGRVSRNRDLYVSNERLEARLQQNRRNAATLESTTAVNELGQAFTLAELAGKSTAKKTIRRAELMTRISGFERIARDMVHTGLFITLTCPSRFHRFRTVNDGKIIIDNPNYDPRESPKTGQEYLARIWSHMRAELKRKGISPYGFRIAEPQHDATPHWHLLLFCKPEDQDTVYRVLSKHALKDSPDEPGAAQHRCLIKVIDWSKGSAAGYVAKYLAKNIDGEHVGEDLNGRPATETAVRVEAWAANWRVRQFQQIGGPPVGPWRELRRIKSIPANAPEHLKKAHNAVNKTAVFEGRENASVAWDHYCQAQGGVFCGRKACIRLAMFTPEKLGLYGEEVSPRTYGIETTSIERYQEPGCVGTWSERTVHWIIESDRHEWTIQRAKAKAQPMGHSDAERSEASKPWTSVNNCTGTDSLSLMWESKSSTIHAPTTPVPRLHTQSLTHIPDSVTHRR
ncbi:MAG: replication endonuclease [Deltaproteobacteria bacterium]|nr:replication endonuclease [Deltaproteobacteria bacterium]